MKVKIIGFLCEGSNEVPCNLDCVVISQPILTTLQEILSSYGFAILKTVLDKPRFFLFTGSRLSETKTQAEATQLGYLLFHGESPTLRNQLKVSHDVFHEYRLTAEIGGGLTIYDEKDGIATIESSCQ